MNPPPDPLTQSRWKRFFAPNISKRGRWSRAVMTIFLFLLAAWAYRYSGWLTLVFGVSGFVGVFEVWRGWCFLRACGLKTRF